MIITLSLQFRENVAAWVCFYDRKDVFKGFLERVLRLKEVCVFLFSSHRNPTHNNLCMKLNLHNPNIDNSIYEIV